MPISLFNVTRIIIKKIGNKKFTGKICFEFRKYEDLKMVHLMNFIKLFFINSFFPLFENGFTSTCCVGWTGLF